MLVRPGDKNWATDVAFNAWQRADDTGCHLLNEGIPRPYYCFSTEPEEFHIPKNEFGLDHEGGVGFHSQGSKGNGKRKIHATRLGELRSAHVGREVEEPFMLTEREIDCNISSPRPSHSFLEIEGNK